MTMPATASSPRIVAVHSRSTAYATVAKGNNDSSRKRHAVNLTSPFFSFAVDYSRNSRWPPPHPHAYRLIGFRLHCSDSGNSSSSSSSSSTPNSSARGFGSKPRPPSSTSSTDKKPTRMRMDDSKSSVLPMRKSSSNRSNNIPNQAPVLSSQTDGKSGNIPTDVQFEERLQAVKRSALQQKNAEEAKQYGAIDYDTPTMPKSNTVGLGTKIGAAVAALIFGLVFAFGDFIPSEKISPTEESTTVVEKVSAKEREILKKRLQEFEQMLSISQDDPTALEGAAVTLAELGEYDQAASLLEDLTKKKSSDPDVFRLLGEVKYELKDYEGSARAYRNSAMVSETIDFEVIRGLTNAQLGAKKPGRLASWKSLLGLGACQ